MAFFEHRSGAYTRYESIGAQEKAICRPHSRNFKSVAERYSAGFSVTAAAAFRAVGLDVIACSSPERDYSLPSLPTSRDRRLAFHDYVTERSAWVLYSLRGWVAEGSS